MIQTHFIVILLYEPHKHMLSAPLLSLIECFHQLYAVGPVA